MLNSCMGKVLAYPIHLFKLLGVLLVNTPIYVQLSCIAVNKQLYSLAHQRWSPHSAAFPLTITLPHAADMSVYSMSARDVQRITTHNACQQCTKPCTSLLIRNFPYLCCSAFDNLGKQLALIVIVSDVVTVDCSCL